MTTKFYSYIDFRFRHVVPFCAKVYDGQGAFVGIILLTNNSLDTLATLFGKSYTFASFVMASLATEADTVIGFFEKNQLVMLEEPTPFIPSNSVSNQLMAAATREVEKDNTIKRDKLNSLLGKK
jgi:hypothetical protein